MSLKECIEVALRKLPTMACETDSATKKDPSLLFPCTNLAENPKKRISEQEARVLFCSELLTKQIPFSIETPTKHKYCFTGQQNTSGRLDVCIHNADGSRKHCIEFKANNEGENETDFEKLLREDGDNYFIHVLEHADKETFSNITGKYVKQLSEAPGNIKEKYEDTLHYKSLTFYLCVLDPFALYTAALAPNDDSNALKWDTWPQPSPGSTWQKCRALTDSVPGTP
jgi:hypothetical protein